MNNIEQDHDELFSDLVKQPQAIIDELTHSKIMLLHMASKLCSEAGELMDAVGKHVYYNKPFDFENATEELGDIEFYLRGIRNTLGISRETVLLHNIEKLRKRYPAGYSDKSAIERLDKV